MVDFKMLTRMIAILAVLIILIFAVVIPFTKKASDIGESSVCSLKLFLTSTLQSATLGLVTPKTPSECKTKMIKITADMIKDKLDEAELAIEKYYSDSSKYAEAISFFKQDGESSRWEWALDKIIADELFNCWAFKAAFGSINTINLLSYDTVCLECAIIMFKDVEKIKEKIGIGKDFHKSFITDKNYIGSLGAFMRAETKGSQGSAYSEKTYAEWINNNFQLYPLIEVPFSLDEQYSVVYVMFRGYNDVPLFGNVQKTWLELKPSMLFGEDHTWFGNNFKKCEKILG